MIQHSLKRMLCTGLTLALTQLLSMHAPVAAQGAYPNKSVKLIVPFPPGGGNDVIGRVIAQKLSDRWGQTVVVDNRAGADRKSTRLNSSH